jgi:hypothetical protein
MESTPIPENIRRFILSSIDSVAYLEAMLLLRYDPCKDWDPKALSQGLYVSEKKAGELLVHLCATGLAGLKEENGSLYHYNPISEELKETINQLSEIYAKHLIEVTHLIHSKTERQAQQFGDAFNWQDKKDGK